MSNQFLGKFGSVRYSFLENEKPEYFAKLQAEGTLIAHCKECNERAHDLSFDIQEEYLKKNPPPDSPFMERVQAFYGAQAIGDEIAMSQIILEE
ncbi:MAG: TnpV protein [Eubacteriales bacterium]